MIDRDAISRTMKEHYERTWSGGDAWDLESSPFEHARYQHQLNMVAGRRYDRVLEIGCGSGRFTRMLTSVADEIVAIDISETAIERARQQLSDTKQSRVTFIAADALKFDAKGSGPWDLIILSETIYCPAWLYSMFDVAWFSATLFDATRDGGQLLLANTLGLERDYLLRPWLIRTYRDLLVNIGYELTREEFFEGNKDGAELKVLMSLLTRRAATSEPTTLS